MTVAPALHARQVQVKYRGTTILRPTSLSVQPGQVVAVLGPTGAGKTTLFRVICGEVRAEQGTVWLGETDVTGLPLWRRARLGLGYMPQGPSVLVDLTVRKNLDTYEAYCPHETQGAVFWAAKAGLEHRLDVRAGDLSGGERRLLELARVLIGRARVLICDEPFSGVDPIRAEKIALILRELARSGLAVLLSDHHAPLALRTADWAVLLVNGEILLEKPPGEFAQHPAARRHYLG